MPSLTRSKRADQLALEKPGIVFADLSNNQGQGTFHAGVYCKTHPFLIHKATQGKEFVDEFHASRSEEVHEHGRAIGHYMFLESGTTPLNAVEETWHFLKVVDGHVLKEWPGRPIGYKTDFFVIDFEVSVTQPNEVLKRICEILTRSYPTIPIIGYSNYFRIGELGLRLPTPRARWWAAAYPGPVRSLPNGQRLWAHQYIDHGRVQGISVPCDKSILLDKQAREYWSSGTYGNK